MLRVLFLFQSTHPRRVWPQARASMINAEQFQSTHPRRVWHPKSRLVYRTTCFNPHTHAGCDILIKCLHLFIKCFNPHTHAGCDILFPIWIMLMFSFNPHTHAGCDDKSWKLGRSDFVSIHTPTQGVTNWYNYQNNIQMFQSTHPRRVWHRETTRPREDDRFNPHTHAGCDFHLFLIIN